MTSLLRCAICVLPMYWFIHTCQYVVESELEVLVSDIDFTTVHSAGLKRFILVIQARVDVTCVAPL